MSQTSALPSKPPAVPAKTDTLILHEAPPVLSGFEPLRMVLSLLLVLALLVVALKYLQRWQRNGRKSAALPYPITPLHSKRLGPACALHVVQVGDKTLLLGSGGAGSTPSLLSVLDDQATLQ